MKQLVKTTGTRALGPFSAFLQHRSLTLELTKRDILGRYRGASFGLLWSLISPFLMLGVYSFAFGFVMKSKWPPVNGHNAHFSVILFVALIVHGFFAECLSRSPQLITSQPNFVKRVIFPLEILPWSMLLSALFHMAMNVLAFLLLRLAVEGVLTWTIIYLPLVVLPLMLLTLGVSWLLAALGVYLRDIGQIMGVLTTALLFMSSAVIPLSAVPEAYRILFRLNPLTFIIDQARQVSLWGGEPDWLGLFLYGLGGLAMTYIGYMWFNATRKGFGDVL
ncbi:MAG TPA: ABC transporter permease [Candidatus Saccharimonadales bacterium]|nr:ABC transporter permease [Candidatus Saccharimonadales bacterium]